MGKGKNLWVTACSTLLLQGLSQKSASKHVGMMHQRGTFAAKPAEFSEVVILYFVHGLASCKYDPTRPL